MLDSWGVLCVILGELLSVIPYGISGLGRAHELGWPAGGGRGHRIRIILCRINSNTGSPGPAVLVGSAGRPAEAGDPVFELICAKFIQKRGLRARPCSWARPAGRPHLN